MTQRSVNGYTANVAITATRTYSIVCCYYSLPRDIVEVEKMEPSAVRSDWLPRLRGPLANHVFQPSAQQIITRHHDPLRQHRHRAIVVAQDLLYLICLASSLIVCERVPHQELQAICSRNGVEAANTSTSAHRQRRNAKTVRLSDTSTLVSTPVGGVGSTRLILPFVACRLSALPAPSLVSHWMAGASQC